MNDGRWIVKNNPNINMWNSSSSPYMFLTIVKRICYLHIKKYTLCLTMKFINIWVERHEIMNDKTSFTSVSHTYFHNDKCVSGGIFFICWADERIVLYVAAAAVSNLTNSIGSARTVKRIVLKIFVLGEAQTPSRNSIGSCWFRVKPGVEELGSHQDELAA